MELLTALLIAASFLKLFATARAVRWLLKRGGEYAALRDSGGAESPEARRRAYEQTGGSFFPFGVVDFRLDGKIEALRLRRSPWWRPLRFLRTWLFRFNRTVLVTCAYVFLVAGFADGMELYVTAARHERLLYCLAVIPLLTNALTAAEAVCSYNILGSYAIGFHARAPRLDGGPGGAAKLKELRLFLWKVLAAVAAGAAACYVAHIKFGALSGGALMPRDGGPWERAGLYLQCVYFAFTTFTTVGYGDIEPADGYGQLASFLIQAQSFSLVVLVLASLLASGQDGRGGGGGR